MGTKPSRKASTSLAVNSGVDCGDAVVEALEDSVRGVGFGTCDQAATQQTASTHIMTATPRGQMVPTDFIRSVFPFSSTTCTPHSAESKLRTSFVAFRLTKLSA